MDIRELMKQFGVEDETADSLVEDPRLQKLMSFPGMNSMLDRLSGMVAQGGIMPDDLENITQQVGSMPGGFDGILAGMGNFMGGTDFDGNDLDEEVAEYEPEAYDAGDRAFVTELKAWIKDTASDIPAADVCMLEIGYHLTFPDEPAETVSAELWLGYNTAQTDAEHCADGHADARWNPECWTDKCFRLLDEEPLADWYESQGYDLQALDDEDELKQRICDLAVLTVTELHRERFTEQHFGRKIPFIIADSEYDEKTAVRAVKANGGKELFDQAFFDACGVADDHA